ncbi:uncharacterized protein LOC141613942 [Silene latifolia]|uniref:uncharacterized protein LOC141613942 n=1 Tax=Silene latifolia TaxID=37657 RepID=UPI003D779D2C
MADFNSCLADYGMDDMQGSGSDFTWFNKQEVGTRVYSKLDRVLINVDWLLSYTQTTAQFLPPGISDHCPAILSFFGDPLPKKQFKFLNCWIDHPDFKTIVTEAWQISPIGNSMHRLMNQPEKEELNQCFQDLQQSPLSEDLIHKERTVSQKYLSLKDAETKILIQKAKVHNIKHNDICSKFFFVKIKERQQSQYIGEIQDIHGTLHSGVHEVGEAFVDYYQPLLGSSSAVQPIDPSFIPNGQCLNEQDQVALTAPISKDEIKSALFSIHSSKSPGIDGFSSGFFKATWDIIANDFYYYEDLLGKKSPIEEVKSAVLAKGKVCRPEHIAILTSTVTYEEVQQAVFSIPKDKAPGPDGYSSGFFRDTWDLIGKDFYAAVVDFFNTSQLLQQINATNITLIPKCDRPTSVKQFRPIACCNMIYKFISKLLCNRLAPDIVHMYARSHVSSRCLFKIDLQKAYDTVEWDFVKQLLSGLNFPSHFTKLVMGCIRSTSFTLVLNGNNFGYFRGQRGLRQGDPISTLIFTICMEYLTRLIAFSTERWPFHYHHLCKNLKLTHLMFADDLLMFCKGDAPSIMLLMKAFTSFSNASGLRMNNTKSEIFFSGMVPELQTDVLRVTGFQEGTMPFRYLGVPTQPGLEDWVPKNTHMLAELLSSIQC